MNGIEWLTNPIIKNYEILTIGAVLIALILLAIIAWRLTSPSNRTTSISLDSSVTETLNEIAAATQHHVEVSAVIGLIKQIETDPDALEMLKSYPETVRAASWLHYINLLGSDLQHAQNRLSSTNRQYGAKSLYAEQEQMDVNVIRKKLDDAIKASGQSNLRAV